MTSSSRADGRRSSEAGAGLIAVVAAVLTVMAIGSGEVVGAVLFGVASVCGFVLLLRGSRAA